MKVQVTRDSACVPALTGWLAHSLLNAARSIVADTHEGEVGSHRTVCASATNLHDRLAAAPWA